MFGVTVVQLLGFTVIAAIVTTLGNLIATVLKETVLNRSFEGWKEQRSADMVYRRYRDPILLSGTEFAYRLSSINEGWPKPYLRSSVLNATPSSLQENSITDPYFMRYQLTSTVYRLCALLGWLELYRQDITFLEARFTKQPHSVEQCLNVLREDMADGRLNTASDWLRWKDRIIFREEQRAIGEAMIVKGPPRVVCGYGGFEPIFSNPTSDAGRWVNLVTQFFVDPGEPDFRRIRFRRLEAHVIDLMLVLDEARVPADLKTRRRVLEQDLAAANKR